MRLALKVPPPVVLLIFGILMWFVGSRVPGGRFEFDNQLAAAISVGVLGLIINVNAIHGFRRAKTTVNPLHPGKATQLVVGGVFRLSRNPMYLGILVVLIGWAIWIGSFYNVALIALFVYYITEFQIRPEEEVLRPLFGEAYADYCSKVRRWI